MFQEKCAECDRIFDLTNEEDAAEWADGHDCEPPAKNFWQLLADAPKPVSAIADLVSLSTNYEIAEGTPYQLYLDVIGYSDQEYGQKLCPAKFTLDWMAMDVFAEAILAYANRTELARNFIEELANSEA